jgi:hypothetical protein
MHTFVKRNAVNFEKMHSQSCRRLKFLSRKLIEDLTTGEKIFVFKIAERFLGEDELGRLRSAMGQYGNNALLYVRLEDDVHPCGTVVQAGHGLMIGYIDQFSITPSGDPRSPSITAWTEICRKAHAIWRADGRSA